MAASASLTGVSRNFRHSPRGDVQESREARRLTSLCLPLGGNSMVGRKGWWGLRGFPVAAVHRGRRVVREFVLRARAEQKESPW